MQATSPSGNWDKATHFHVTISQVFLGGGLCLISLALRIHVHIPLQHQARQFNQNVTFVAMKFIENSCQQFAENHLLVVVDLFHQPSKTTIQIANDSILGHPHLLLARSTKLLGSNISQSELSGNIATHGSPTQGSPGG
jgi:hypothetical protein